MGKPLEGQLETFAKQQIKSGTVLGQYVGHELLEDEFCRIYNGTREEIDHMKYLMGESISYQHYTFSANPKKKRKLNENYRSSFKENVDEEITIFIDPLSAMPDSPLIRINDGRQDIFNPKLTSPDKRRINCAFVSILVNKWPAIFLITTKTIKKNESLHVYYGEGYRLILESEKLNIDARNKWIAAAKEILTKLTDDEGRRRSSATVQKLSVATQ